MKTYKNITNVEQLDIPPGETGERELLPDEEARMVDRGAIEVVGEPAEQPAPDAGGEKTPEEIEAEQKAAEDQAAAEQAERDAQARQRGGRGRS